MAGAPDDFIKQGLVDVKGRKFGGIWRKRWIVLRRYSSAGPTRLELYKEAQGFHRFNDPSVRPRRVIPLLNVSRVATVNCPRSKSKKIKICFANSLACDAADCFDFRVESSPEAHQWHREIETLSTMVYADVRWNESNPNCPTRNETESFRVFLLPSTLLSFSGECLFDVTSKTVTLRSASSLCHRVPQVVVWEIDTIRRFGLDGGALKIETGRSSSTGEGIFIFRSFESHRIERHLNVVTTALSTAFQLTEANVHRLPSVPIRPHEISTFQAEFHDRFEYESDSEENPRRSSRNRRPPVRPFYSSQVNLGPSNPCPLRSPRFACEGRLSPHPPTQYLSIAGGSVSSPDTRRLHPASPRGQYHHAADRCNRRPPAITPSAPEIAVSSPRAYHRNPSRSPRPLASPPNFGCQRQTNQFDWDRHRSLSESNAPAETRITSVRLPPVPVSCRILVDGRPLPSVSEFNQTSTSSLADSTPLEYGCHSALPDKSMCSYLKSCCSVSRTPGQRQLQSPAPLPASQRRREKPLPPTPPTVEPPSRRCRLPSHSPASSQSSVESRRRRPPPPPPSVDHNCWDTSSTDSDCQYND